MSSLLTASEDTQVARGIEDGLAGYFPMTSKGGRLTMSVENVRVDWSKDPLAKNPSFLNRARFEGKSYKVPVVARVSVSLDGQLHDTADIVIGPYYPRAESLNARLIDGRIYQNKYQIRRKSGVYPFRNTKNEPVVEFNSAGTRNFNFTVDPYANTFDLIVKSKSDTPVQRGVYVLLKVFGVPETDIKAMWGDLYKYNAQVLSPSQNESEAKPLDLLASVKRMYNAFVPNTTARKRPEFAGGSVAEACAQLRDWLSGPDSFDRSATQATMGVASPKMSAELVLAAARKLTNVYQGRDKIDSRFNERFRTLHGVPTQIREGLLLDNKMKGAFKNKAQRQLDYAENNLNLKRVPASEIKVKALFQVAGALKTKIHSAYTNSELSTTTETNNILDIHNRAVEVTIKGPGGITSDHAIQPETVDLHPSRLGLTDFVRTQPAAPGVTVPLANGAVPGERGEIHRRLFDRKTGVVRTVTAEEADEGRVGFADEFTVTTAGGKTRYEPKGATVFASDGDEVRRVPERQVRYVVADTTDMFSDGTNIIPFLHHNSGPRAIMGANQMGQAISLKNPEAPLVDTVGPDGRTFSLKIGEEYNVRAKVDGTVSRVGEDSIEVTGPAGKTQHAMLRNFPLNQGGFIHQESRVKKGDAVKTGDLLTKNNYTDKDGELAIGVNLLTAYMPYKGYNYEDGLVISEGAARKMSSEHIYQYTLDVKEEFRTNVRAYNSAFSDRGKRIGDANRGKLQTVQFKGEQEMDIVREGEDVESGDVLVPVVSPAYLKNDPEISEMVEKMFGELGMKNRDKSIYWDEEEPGRVVKVVATPTKIHVYVKVAKRFKEGDKISGRHGEKGIVAKVLPDSIMPQRKNPKTGELEAVEMLVDPHGVPSRANPGQILELAAGKLAHHTGERYLVKNFTEGEPERIAAGLKAAGLTDKEDLIDPITGKTIPQVAVGYAYKAKLKHQLDKKFSVRGMNEGYDLDEQPTGGAAVDNLTVYALAGHNARANLSEMTRLKGTANHKYWTQLATGLKPANVAEVPFAYRKFEAMMRGLGVNVVKNADELTLVPLTDRDIERQSAGEIEEVRAYDSYNKKRGVQGFRKGLFDPKLTGPTGKNWNHINLAEPTPNPLFLKPIFQLLKEGEGLRGAGFKIQKGTKTAPEPLRTVAIRDVRDLYLRQAKVVGPDGREYTGGQGLKDLLSKVNLEATKTSVHDRLKEAMKTDTFNAGSVSDLHETLRYASNLIDHDIRPEDAFVLTKIPVMPPEFRKPLLSPEEIFVPSVNRLYASVIAEQKNLAHGQANLEPEKMIADYRKSAWTSLAALIGRDGGSSQVRPVGDFEAVSILSSLTDPRIIQGSGTFGKSDSDGGGPKESYPQRKVLRKKQDLSGRSTIIPSGMIPIEMGGGDVRVQATDALDVDQVGLPEEMAWKIYEPFVRNRLVQDFGGPRNGADRAKKEYEAQTPKAKKALVAEMAHRPVMLNRAPSWWPYSVMAFKPVLMDKQSVRGEFAEKAIRVPNLVVAPYFGGDFDGDTMGVHVPAEEEARLEALTLLPSLHLRAPGSGNLMIVPTQSQLLGLNFLTRYNVSRAGIPVALTDARKIAEQFRRGELLPEQMTGFTANGQRMTAGWTVLERAIRQATGEKFGLQDLMKAYEEETGRALDLRAFALDKKNTNALMTVLAKRFPNHYARVAQELSREGDRHATEIGFTVGLSDIVPHTAAAKKEIKRVERLIPQLAKARAGSRKAGQAASKEDTRWAREQLFSGQTVVVNGKTEKSFNRAMDDHLKSVDPESSTLIQMMQIGSKGNIEQVRQLLGAVSQVRDVHKRSVDEPIYGSYGSGLKGGEYYIQQRGALSGLRDRAVETRDPGYLGKQIVAASQELVVTVPDCHTAVGIDLPLQRGGGPNPDLNGRFLAGTAFAVTPAAIHAAIAARKQTMRVRSPLTCAAETGVCQHCFGYTVSGHLPPIGDNVGVREGQSIVESSTKLTLKSFHTGGSASANEVSFDRLKEIIQIQSPKNKAVVIPGKPGDMAEILAKEPMTIRGRSGGLRLRYRITSRSGKTSESAVMIPPGAVLLPGIDVRSKVPVGTAITPGDLDPHEIGRSLGFDAQQTYLTDALHGVIESAGNLSRRTAETAIASMGSFALVKNPGTSAMFAGDKRKIGQILAYNAGGDEDTPTGPDAVGRRLAEDTPAGIGPPLEKGHEVTVADLDRLRMAGVRRLRLERKKITFQRQFHSVNQTPHVTEDWLAKMNFEELSKEIRQGTPMGQTSKLHGPNPISAYMHGQAFDKGLDPTRWKY